MSKCSVIVLIFTLSLVATPTLAQEVWQGTTSNDWSIGTNWQDGSAPGSTNTGTLTIANPSVAFKAIYSSAQGSTTFTGLLDVVGGGVLEVTGGSLTTNGGGMVSVASGPAAISILGGVLDVTGSSNTSSFSLNSSSTFTSTFAMNGGTFVTNGFTKTGTVNTLTVLAGGTIQAASSNANFLDELTGNTIQANANIAFNTAGFNIGVGAGFSGGTVTKTGAGNLSFTGNGGANTVIINQGSVVLDRTGDYTLSSTFSGAGTLTKQQSGKVLLQGNLSGLSGTLRVSSGTVEISNLTSLNNNMTINTDTGTWIAASDGSFSNVVSGAGGFDKVAIPSGGTGNLTLIGNHTYTGSTKVSAGELRLTGTINSASTVDIASGAGFKLAQSTNQTFANSITGSGTFVVENTIDVTLTANSAHTGTISMNGGKLILGAGGTSGSINSSAISLGGGARLQTNRTNSTTIAGNVTGTGGFDHLGSGTTNLTGTNTYSGTTTIGETGQGGTVNIGNGTSTGSFGTGQVLNNGAIIFDRTGDYTIANSISGNGGVTKQQSGQLTLTGLSTYSGATNVAVGTLAVNGAISNTNVTVASGARLQGTGGVGTSGGSVTVNGTIAAGNSIGIMGTGSLVFNANSQFEWEYNSDLIGTTPLSSADMLQGFGALTINGGSLSISDLGSANITNPTKFSLIRYSLNSWNGGTFNGLANNSSFQSGGRLWTIRYNDTTTGINFGSSSGFNFVTLTLTAVPEPASFCLVGLSVLLSARFRLRRNDEL